MEIPPEDSLGSAKLIDSHATILFAALEGRRQEIVSTVGLCAANLGPRTRSRDLKHQDNVRTPFERSPSTSLDFPESDRRNRYLLLVMDYFTKWSEVYAIPNHEASTVADVLLTSVTSGSRESCTATKAETSNLS